MPYSHHSHSGQFCSHAKHTLEEVVQEAIQQKFQVYCLTEHCPRYRDKDLYPEEIDAGVTLDQLASKFQDFLTEAHALKSKYASQITLLVGLESEYITDSTLRNVTALIQANKSQIDVVVGSVHHVNEIPIDFDQETFEKARQSLSSPDEPESRQEEFFLRYFDAQYEVMSNLHPEIIGHFDLCRLYTPDHDFKLHPSVWDKIKRNIEYGMSYGALFEVNSAAFRKGWGTAYPGKDVLEFMVEAGAHLTLSDDSHGTHMVGLNYTKAREYLGQMGVNKLWYLSTAAEPNAMGRFSQPVSDPQWGSSPFWEASHPEC